MESKLIYKIESAGILKNKKIFKILAIVAIPLMAMKIYFGVTGGPFQQLGYWLDILVLLFPIINYLYLNKKTANGGGISFIEWWTDKVIYKTRKDNENQIILNSDIKSTSIRLDDIIISIVNGTTFIINLADFTDYKQRLAIKANFEKLSNEVKTI